MLLVGGRLLAIKARIAEQNGDDDTAIALYRRAAHALWYWCRENRGGSGVPRCQYAAVALKRRRYLDKIESLRRFAVKPVGSRGRRRRSYTI